MEDLLALTDREIIARISLGGELSTGLPSIPAHMAKDKIVSVLKSVYVPSQQVLRIVARALSMMQDHYHDHYASPLNYRRGINNLKSPVPTALPLCLTGLPGIGKTELAKAVMRLVQDQIVADIGDGYGPAALTPGRYVRVTAGSSLLRILEQAVFDEKELGNKLSFDNLNRIGPRKVYRDGLALLILDEMQVFARGSAESVNIIKLLSMSADLGPPQFHISNFRNVGKIKASEVTDRLLAECVVMTPEVADDPAEMELRRAYAAVTARVVPNEDDFWSCLNAITFRIHRTRIKLLGLAFEITRSSARSVISINDLKSASLASQFAIKREQVRALSKMAIDGKTPKGHKDLECPLGTHFAFPADAKQTATAAEDAAVEAAAARSSLTPGEAKILDKLTCQETDCIKKEKSRRPRATYESLVASERARVKPK
jgi:hypothetical protein